MGVHDLLAVPDVLDGVLSLVFFDHCVGGNALLDGEALHAVRFDEAIVRGAAGDDDVSGDAGAELAHAFEDALPLLGRGRAAEGAGSAEDDEGIEVFEGGVGGRDCVVVGEQQAEEQRGFEDSELADHRFRALSFDTIRAFNPMLRKSGIFRPPRRGRRGYRGSP